MKSHRVELFGRIEVRELQGACGRRGPRARIKPKNGLANHKAFARNNLERIRFTSGIKDGLSHGQIAAAIHMEAAILPRCDGMPWGNKLVPVDQKPGQDQIRDSNNYSIAAYAELAGATIERMPLTGDETSLLKNQIAKAAENCDVIVTSGGVSMGVYDVTKAALKELDAELFFERVALRPGKPTVFARLPNGTLAFGLPGNPVSVAVTFNLFARTSLLAMQGATEPALKRETAALARKVKGTADRESYLPVQLTTNDDGELIAFPLKWGGSSDFVAFALTTALAIVPAGIKAVEAGSLVNVVRLP